MSLPLVEYQGRKLGGTAGSHMDDMVALKKAIILCFSCLHRFGEPRRKNYYKDRRFGYVNGKCDDCRKHYNRAALLIHEEYLTGQGEKSRPGQSWLHT